MKLIILALLLLASFTGCKPNGEHNNMTNSSNDTGTISFSMNHRFLKNYYDDSVRKQKIEKASKTQDSLAFNSVASDYLMGGGENEFMFYALSIAQSRGYGSAYFVSYLYFDRLKEDKKFRLLADYYLINSYLKGDRSAQLAVKVKFGERVDSARLISYYHKIEKALIRDDIHY